MKIFLIAGEESGDILGADFMASLKETMPENEIEFYGIGGERMIEEGLSSLFPMEELSLMGIAEIAPKIPHLLKRIHETIDDIERIRPDIVMTIDAPDFSFRVVKGLRKRGGSLPILMHYVAPTVWAWRPGRAKKVAELYDSILCLFPFEPAYFQEAGMEAVFTGHPMTTLLNKADRKAFRKEYHIPDDGTVIGVLLGSRESEIRNMEDILIPAAEAIAGSNISKPYIIVPTLPSLAREIRQMVEHIPTPTMIITDHKAKQHALAACDVAMATSGTVGLELSYLGVPHVIGYKMNRWTYEILKRIVTTKYIHLSNIILDRPAIPELIQSHCTAEEFSKRALRLLNDEAVRNEQLESFEEVRKHISSEEGRSPSQVAAEYVYETLKKRG